MVHKFEAIIKKLEDKDGAYIEIPFDVEKEFGAKRVKVKAKFDNIEYRGSIVKMGGPCHMIGITKDIRKKLGKDQGDIISVQVEKDEEERIVEIPEDFAKIMEENSGAKEFYESLSYSGKRKYVNWINSAKKVETRQKRIAEAILKLKEKIKL